MSLHVVVGAGGTGAATARQLADAGERVRLVTRRGSGPDHPQIERVAADAADAARLTRLAEGAATLFNCAAPAYHRWPAQFPPLARAMLTAAEHSGAGYVMLGNLYAYGPVASPMTEDLPLAATTVKGRIRAKIWQDALAAHQAGRVRVTEVRASDFIGAGAVSLVTLTISPKVLAGKPAFVPADLDAPHSWTATGDAASALIALSRDDRSWGRSWHVPTSPPLSVRQLAAALAGLAGAPAPRIRRIPGPLLTLAGTFSPLIRELPEMQYQFQQPFELDSSATEQAFGLTPSPVKDALAQLILR